MYQIQIFTHGWLFISFSFWIIDWQVFHLVWIFYAFPFVLRLLEFPRSPEHKDLSLSLWLKFVLVSFIRSSLLLLHFPSSWLIAFISFLLCSLRAGTKQQGSCCWDLDVFVACCYLNDLAFFLQVVKFHPNCLMKYLRLWHSYLFNIRNHKRTR